MADFGSPIGSITGLALEHATSSAVTILEGDIYIVLGVDPIKLVRLNRYSLEVVSEYQFAAGENGNEYNIQFVYNGKAYIGISKFGATQIAIVDLATMTRAGTISGFSDQFSMNGLIRFGDTGYASVRRAGGRLYRINLLTNTVIDYLDLSITSSRYALTITDDGGYVIVAGIDAIARIRVDSHPSLMVKDGQLSYSGGDTETCILIDSVQVNNYVLVCSDYPKVYKFALSGTFRQVNSLALSIVPKCSIMISDLYNRNALMGMFEPGGAILKIDRTSWSEGIKVTTGADYIVCGVTMLDYSYWGTCQTPGKVVKVRNEDLSVQDIVTLPTGYNLIYGMFIYS